MVAFLAAMTQAPITSLVIVMEMTANHEMLLPLMATAVVANAVSKSVCPLPIYHTIAHSLLRNAEHKASRHHARTKHPATQDTAPPDTKPATEQ
jgi:H+/Cl- antiporter ClcA